MVMFYQTALIAYQKTVTFTLIAMRTSDLIQLLSWEKNVFPITMYIIVITTLKNINIKTNTNKLLTLI